MLIVTASLLSLTRSTLDLMLPDPPSGKSGWPWTAPDSTPGRVEQSLDISIIVPTLNQALFLEEALRSILLQGWPSVELIVIDGGSSDGSVDILRRYDDCLAYWITEPDSGQTAAINKGLRHATGEWIGWLNSDDIYFPHTFEVVADLVAKHPGSEWIVGATAYLSGSLEEIGVFEPIVGSLVREGLSRWLDFACSKRTKTGLPQPSSFWTRRLQEEVGPLDESFSLAMDHELWVRFARHGHEPLLSGARLAGFRFHEQQKTWQGEAPFWEEERRLVAGLILETEQEERAVLESYHRELGFRIRLEVMRQSLIHSPLFPVIRRLYRLLTQTQQGLRHSRLIRSVLDRLPLQIYGGAEERSSRVSTDSNIDPRTIAGFGHEWEEFDQRRVPEDQLRQIFTSYFELLDWDALPPDASVLDVGCGGGRWARFAAEKAGLVLCVDASEKALRVARTNLSEHSNCSFISASAGRLPFRDGIFDMAYSLGVLHHIPDTSAGVRSVVDKLKPGAPLIVYIYYALENQPLWFRWMWRVSDVFRRGISRLPHRMKVGVTSTIAAVVYLPLSRLSRLLERFGANAETFPLSIYRDKGFYTMRTDAYDRFGTSLEQRFTREQIVEVLLAAGVEDVEFAGGPPYWRAIGWKRRG